MYRSSIVALALTASLLTACQGDTPAARAADTLGSTEQPATGSGLGDWLVAWLKSEVISLSESNTLRSDNLEQVREQLVPRLSLLALHFALHRPSNELELTKGTWRQVWSDSDDVRSPPGSPVQVDQANIFQVVADGYYYNLSNTTFATEKGPVLVHGFLKGNYTIAWPASPDTAPALGLNVIDLEFDVSAARPGPLPTELPLVDLVAEVDPILIANAPGLDGQTFFTPGPKGVTGKLFNLYVDEQVRFAAGYRDDEPDDVALFILRRASTAAPLPPFQPTF